jgi:hypothetical protein
MTSNLPRHLVLVAGMSPLPIYQILSMKISTHWRWKKVDILVNKATKKSLDMALSLFDEDPADDLSIVLHDYANPGISFEKMYSLFNLIREHDGTGYSIYPGLGPRSLTIPLLWKFTSEEKLTILQLLHDSTTSVIEESPIFKHKIDDVALEDYLNLYDCSLLVDEGVKGGYIVDTKGSKIGPFLDIELKGFLNLKYDSRISEDAHDKISTRNYHAIVQQLEAIFGRNAIKMDITTLPVSRTNPETHTTQEKLNFYSFHQFFDPKNITLTCLALYGLVRIFSGSTGSSGCRIYCYIDIPRGLTLEESESIILNRMNMSELTDRQREYFSENVTYVSLEDIDRSMGSRAMKNTNLHVVNARSGSVQGHILLENSLSKITILENLTLGKFDPVKNSWEIAPRNEIEEIKNWSKEMKLKSIYALSGWNLKGEISPSWKILDKKGKPPNAGQIMADIDRILESFARQSITTIGGGTVSKTTFRTVNPNLIRYSHLNDDEIRGNHVKFECPMGMSQQTPPFKMEWMPSGGKWLECLCEIIIWKLFKPSKAEIIYNAELSRPTKGPQSQYSPEGIIKLGSTSSGYLHLVWEVKSMPLTQPTWPNHISQVSEYANLAPYRNTIPLLIHGDENPPQELLDYAKISKVILCPWWELPQLKGKVAEWCDQHNVTLSPSIKIPSFDYNPTSIVDFETTFDTTNPLPIIKKTKEAIAGFNNNFNKWFNSLSPEMKKEQEADLWVKPLLHLNEIPSKKSITKTGNHNSEKSKKPSRTKGDVLESTRKAIKATAPCDWHAITSAINEASTKEERSALLRRINENGMTAPLKLFEILEEHFADLIYLEGEGNERKVLLVAKKSQLHPPNDSEE